MGQILWLASYPKSGNTWLRLFLAALLRGGDGGLDINRIGEATLAEPGVKGFALFDERPWRAWSDLDVARMRPRVQERIAATGPGMVAVKTHSAFMKVAGIPTINMDVTAGAVYVVRNPLDVAVSYAAHLGHTIDEIVTLMNTAMFATPTTEINVTELMGSWSQHVASWTASGSPLVHVMRYEDILADPRAAFTGLVRFMRIDADAQAIERAVERSRFERVQAIEAETGFVERTPAQERFFRAGRSGQWQEALTADQVAAIVAVHREQMARFGYIPKGF